MCPNPKYQRPSVSEFVLLVDVVSELPGMP